MPTSVTWNNSARSIPSAGELNWSALAAFLVDLANNAQTTNFQKMGITTATVTPVNVSAASNCIVVTDLTIAGAVAVNLPAGVSGQVFFILDGKGDASTNNITIDANGAQTINGSLTYVINRDRGGVGIAFNGTEWKIFAEFSNEVQIRKVTGTHGVPFDVVAGTGVTTVPNSLFNIIYVQGSGGAVDVSANPQIAAGTRNGDELTLHGCSDANTVYLEHGNGLFLNGNMYLKNHSTLTLNWDSTNSLWVEKSRTEY